MNDGTFYSPYQFIPVTGRLQQPARGANGDPAADAGAPNQAAGPTGQPVPKTPWEAIAQGQTQVRHDCWQPGTLSGRLLCRLTTVTPTLVGAEQTEGDQGLPGTITNYRSNGELAIPGSSLRGAIGAVAEALSQSAMRVLDQREFSVRKPMGGSLKAIGLLRRQPDGGWRLLPLAMTGLPSDPPRVHIPAPWNQVFPATLPLGECLAAYYGVYGDPANDPARFACFQARDNPCFVWSAEVVDARLARASAGDLYEIRGDQDALMVKEINGQPGRFARRRGCLRDLQTAAAGLAGQPMRGVTYVLGLRSEHKLMPKKKHEWFVPYAEDWEARLAAARADRQATLPVSPKAIAAFERIARERDLTNDRHTPPDYRVPFLPAGYGGRSPDGPMGLLRDGDLVYFDVDQKGLEVTEVSFSSIWRGSVCGDLHRAFARVAGGDALPWNPGRDGLTPAECLFGVVEALPQERGKSVKARNLAARVRFSDAFALGALERFYPADQPIALRQLQSPKPPSPAMYFQTATGGPVRKLPAARRNKGTPPLPGLDLERHRPNGRKHYLVHDPREVLAKRPWETRKLDTIERLDPAGRHALLRDYARQGGRYGNPLSAGQTLWFHVDFDNLTQGELDLLCTAIDPGISQRNPLPGATFHHRLGWGRPVGLGVVRVVIKGLFLMARHRRYRAQGLQEPRYQRRLLAPVPAEVQDQLVRRYPQELAEGPLSPLPDDLRVAADLIDGDALGALMQFGDPAGIDRPVSYPYAQGQKPQAEEDGYLWFVHNDQGHDDDYQSIQPRPQVGADADADVTRLSALTRR